MKRLISLTAALMAVLMLNGCIALSFGGGSKTESKKATAGQQLTDLRKAKDSGAITEAEFQAQKAKVLHDK